jgi:hypothetical protein
MTKGMKTAIWLIGVGLVILWIAVESTSSSRSPTVQQQSQYIGTYNATRLCDDAFKSEYDFSKSEKSHIVIELHDGCWSSFVYLPNWWPIGSIGGDFFAQSTGDLTGFWMKIWLGGQNAPDAALFGPNFAQEFQSMGNSFRLQGHGKVVFFTHKPSHDEDEASDKSADQSDAKSAPAIPTDYKKEFCDEPDTVNVTGDNYVATLSSGCFHGPIKIPWSEYDMHHSMKEGDWAAVWCEGQTKPWRVLAYYDDWKPGEINPCGVFYLQGKGTFRFTKLR